MTPVFGHGRLRLYLLKLLDESPRHGYEIIQQLRERFAGLYAPSAGTVYPRLARLESEGLVRHETDRGRKIYHITDAGRAELRAKAAELDALETEIRDSVNDLAEGIRDEVRESARTVREELEAEAREAAAQAAREASGSRTAPSSGWPSMRDIPSSPPPESEDWTREQWRDWRRQRQDQWRAWKQDFDGQRDHWKDWQRTWKDQWARQWKEQWEEQWARQPWQGGPPWSWLFGGGPFGGHDRPRDTAPGDAGAESGGRSGSSRGFDWEVFGPQLRDLFERMRREGGPLLDAAKRHGPLSEAKQAEAKAIIDRAIAELRALFDGPDDAGPTDTF
jgi:DNA-binding PadR family transcriptional regulator